VNRINISYSIEMQELGEEVQRLIDRSSKTLSEAVSSFEKIKLQSSHLDVTTYEQIDEVRLLLAQVDYGLGDISSIINSYNIYQLNQLNNEQQYAQPSEVQE